MSLKEKKNKSRQSNWTNLQKDGTRKLLFNKKHTNNSFKTVDFMESQYNFNKIIQKKKPPNLLHDIRSSSTSNFYPSNKVKNSLVFYPLNIKIPMINKSNKNIDKKRIGNKSPIDIIKIPKTNMNNNNKVKINYNTIKVNTNKNKDNKNINYLLSACNLSAKNINSGLFKRKIKDKNNTSGLNNLSNSMTFINNNHKVTTLNSSNNNIVGNNTNINININNKNAIKYEEAKKEQERLNALYNEKTKYSQKINEKIKDLDSKNKILIQKINKIKKDNDKYASTLDKIIKLIKLSKNNGFDVADIMKNLSEYDDNEESIEEDEKEEKDEKDKKEKENGESIISTVKDFSFRIGEDKTESNYINDIDTNEYYKHNNKKKKNDDDFDEIKIKKLAKNKIMKNQSKQNEEFSFKNNKKKMIHSSGE